MPMLHLLALAPVTGDDSPQKNLVVFIILGIAAAAALVLGLWKGKK